MKMLAILILLSLAKADDFTAANMPCAHPTSAALDAVYLPPVDGYDMDANKGTTSSLTASVPWPNKLAAAKLVLESKKLEYKHAEKCTELLTVAVSTAAQDEAAAVIGTIAVADGKPVSFDGRKAVAVTGSAADMHELPNGPFGNGGTRLGGYGSATGIDLVTVQNLGFLQGQNSLGTVSGGGSAKSAPPKSKKTDAERAAEAEMAKAKAAAQAEAERAARVEAAKAAAAAVSGN